MNTLLEQLKNKRLVWQANQSESQSVTSSTGYPELDHALQGGFPQQGVMDINSPIGIGELRLLLPTLRGRQQQHNRLLVFIAPPMLINAEMLLEFGLSLQQILIVHPNSPKEALWSAEQCLKSGCCHSVLLWHQQLQISQVKRLQLAAQHGDGLQILFRQDGALSLSLPVNLAMQLSPHQQGVQVRITKRKGGWPKTPFDVDMRRYWPELSVARENAQIIAFPQAKVS